MIGKPFVYILRPGHDDRLCTIYQNLTDGFVRIQFVTDGHTAICKADELKREKQESAS